MLQLPQKNDKVTVQVIYPRPNILRQLTITVYFKLKQCHLQEQILDFILCQGKWLKSKHPNCQQMIKETLDYLYYLGLSSLKSHIVWQVYL